MNKKSKILVMIALLLCMTLVFAGCKKDEPPVDTTPSGPHLVDEESTNTEETVDATDSLVTEDVEVGAEGSATEDVNDPNHVHNYTVAASTDASCEKAGTVTKQCSCGSTKTETNPALGHDYKETTSTEATCTTAGSAVKVCSRCKDKKTETIPAKGHNYKVTSTTKATCSAAGSEVKTCSNCNDKQSTTLPKLNHTYKTSKTTATCTAAGKEMSKCSTCGHVGNSKETPALGHDWKDTITKEATCTTEGSKNRECKRCGEKTTAVVEKADHTYEEVIVAPTCESKGTKEEVCSVCNNVKTRTTLPANGHSYVETVVKAATCTEKGSVVNICSVCEKQTGAKDTPVLGHDYKETAKTPATCTENGSLTETCARCEDSRVTTINATGHAEKIDEVTAPTCGAKGVGHKTCTTCSADLGECEIPALTACDAANVAACDEYVSIGFTCNKCSVCGKLTNVAFSTSQDDAAKAMLDYINGVRSQNGLSALTLSDSLNSSARNRAQTIASNYSSDNSNELISRNNVSIQAIFNVWANSDLLVNPDYTTVGFGYYVGNTPSLFAVAIFG